ncbi:class I SAM-dependent methyltransferase [Streptosporangium sp. NPDC001559]|uniref:class I SAM-dependent methyltransferase n=1 Tax=Streptosporangium sp. NPDC001559 TaxID=3366187 RepID=UPI0036E32FFC
MRLISHELLFDVRHGTDTSLEPPGCTTAHEGTNPLLFAEMLRNTPLTAGGRVFVDFGAGKGRALMLAARHGFAAAIGVESSPELCAIANANIARFGRRRPCALSVTCADAESFAVPTSVTVAYFFHPFGAETMRAVVDRILESLAEVPRDFYVMYLNPRHADVFITAGFGETDRWHDAVLLSRPR